MKTELPQSIKVDIKRVIEVILHEIVLQDAKAVNGVIPVQISDKKFEHHEDLRGIVKKINEGETHSVLHTVSEYEFNKSLYHDEVTGESVAKLMRTKSILELHFGLGEERTAERYLYFLIEDVNGLKKIDVELQQVKISEERPSEKKSKDNDMKDVSDGGKESKAIKSAQEKTEFDILKVKLNIGLLTLNKATGLIQLNKFKTNINPKSQEFEVLLKLMNDRNHQATYTDLLGQDVSKVSKRNLSFVVRNLKEILEILPKKNAVHKNFIKNMKNHGYRLII